MDFINPVHRAWQVDKRPLVPELYCSDFVESRAFYTDILGFSVLYERGENRFAYMEREGAQLMIEKRSDRPYGRGINLQIWTQDVDALDEQVQAHRAVIFLPIEETYYRRNDVFVGNRQFIVQDPDGYMLRFAQDLSVRKP